MKNWSAGCTWPASVPSTPSQKPWATRPTNFTSLMSCRTICYKGMFLAPQLFAYYPDLADGTRHDCPGHRAPALQHQHLPQLAAGPAFPHDRPQRRDQHAEGQRQPPAGLRKDDVLPGSWPATYQNCSRYFSPAAATRPLRQRMELLVRAGRSAPHALMMMIPEAFGPRYHISTDKRAFYEYHAAIMEPWDGPAAMVFTDGRLVGGTLDRNGLRPCRYVVTTDGLVVLASEVGVIEFPPERIQQKGRLQPGRMFLVDTEEGRIVVDNEIKGKIARQKPYRRWLEENRIELRGLFQPSQAAPDRSARRWPSGCGPSATPAKNCRWSSPPWPPTARSRWARWAPTRRWPCSPTGRNCCSTISSNCSPR